MLLMALLGSACGGLPKKPINTDFAERNWQIRTATLSVVQSFELKGRLAESGLTGARGDLSWSQSGERFDVRVSGPLGVGALAISGDPRSVEIHTKDGIFVTDSVETFMQQRLGWSLPIPQLRYWVLGLPAPVRDKAPPTLILDDAGRAQTIKQAGWMIAYDEYQTVGSLSLPRKLSMVNGQRSFRIVVDSWSGTP
jgi:outer membrane lipoprotein LolB